MNLFVFPIYDRQLAGRLSFIWVHVSLPFLFSFHSFPFPFFPSPPSLLPSSLPWPYILVCRRRKRKRSLAATTTSRRRRQTTAREATTRSRLATSFTTATMSSGQCHQVATMSSGQCHQVIVLIIVRVIRCVVLSLASPRTLQGLSIGLSFLDMKKLHKILPRTKICFSRQMAKAYDLKKKKSESC